jgi:pre-mRNA-splicing factor ATP-dependent RNA helicase DHX15/PRP43
VYYDLDTFEDGEVKNSLKRSAERKKRREAMKGGPR